jgi:hypothetical protein
MSTQKKYKMYENPIMGFSIDQPSKNDDNLSSNYYLGSFNNWYSNVVPVKNDEGMEGGNRLCRQAFGLTPLVCHPKHLCERINFGIVKNLIKIFQK